MGDNDRKVICKTATLRAKPVQPTGLKPKGRGVMTTIDGKSVRLDQITEDDIDIRNIAWGLGRILRYNGHIRHDYTVATHCIVMSYIVPEEYALEALLHDAAEAYTGDIIAPVKELFPVIEDFENGIAHKIMRRFEVGTAESITRRNGDVLYSKSPEIAQVDVRLYQHECFGFNRPGGVWWQDIEDKWLMAAEKHAEYWIAPMYAYLERFDELAKPAQPTLDLEELTKVWFPDDAGADPYSLNEADLALIEQMIPESRRG